MLYCTCICLDIAVVADIFLKGESGRMFCVKSKLPRLLLVSGKTPGQVKILRDLNRVDRFPLVLQIVCRPAVCGCVMNNCHESFHTQLRDE